MLAGGPLSMTLPAFIDMVCYMGPVFSHAYGSSATRSSATLAVPGGSGQGVGSAAGSQTASGSGGTTTSTSATRVLDSSTLLAKSPTVRMRFVAEVLRNFLLPRAATLVQRSMALSRAAYRHHRLGTVAFLKADHPYCSSLTHRVDTAPAVEGAGDHYRVSAEELTELCRAAEEWFYMLRQGTDEQRSACRLVDLQDIYDIAYSANNPAVRLQCCL